MITFLNETNFKQLIRLTKEMRVLQRKYFKGDKSVLDACKAKEKEVDSFIKSIEENESKLRETSNSKQLSL
jgi:hypothetical protein